MEWLSGSGSGDGFLTLTESIFRVVDVVVVNVLPGDGAVDLAAVVLAVNVTAFDLWAAAARAAATPLVAAVLTGDVEVLGLAGAAVAVVFGAALQLKWEKVRSYI